MIATEEQADGDLDGRNPTWTRDELILALDLYLRERPTMPDKRSRQGSELSATLNRLAKALDSIKSSR